ncbi:hypothetical protein JW916_00625 [Candidatus Sumerlaeota bacterium]|nr:hypothetical protein [Candidatus Sumerlaeota bacterium]
MAHLPPRVGYLVLGTFVGLIWVWAIGGARSEPFISGYHLGEHCLVLGESVRSESGGLKPFSQMTPSEISTLYHELWHAYFIECESKARGPLYRSLRQAADSRYADFPPEKRLEIHEEAVADFIDATVETFVFVKRFMADRTPEKREEIRGSGLMRSYRTVLGDSYTGYYTRSIVAETPGADAAPRDDSDATTSSLESAPPETPVAEVEILDSRGVLDDFIRDARAFGLPVGYVREAADAMRGVVFIDMGSAETTSTIHADVVWSNVSLSDEDKTLIERILFEGLLAGEPREVFAEEKFSPSEP